VEVQFSVWSSIVPLLFESKVEIPRIMHGQRQSVETLINEEALLSTKYLRGESNAWIPRVPSFPFPTVLESEVVTQE